MPPVIRNLCAELAYIALYRVRHSTDSTAPDPFLYITQRHNQIFADIHARRLRLGIEQHTVDVPMVVGDKGANRRRQGSKKKHDLSETKNDGTVQNDDAKEGTDI